MKLQASEFPFSKPQTRRKSLNLIIPIISLTFLLTILPIYYPLFHKKLSLSTQLEFQQQQNTINSNRLNDGVTSQPEQNPPPAVKNSEPDETPAQSRTSPATSDNSTLRSESVVNKKCDLFTGEWIPNPDAPYYTNETCSAIQEHQNCMKFGRPDLGFLKWRWKPDECELPIFDPKKFLEMVRGKSILFVGDSIARNHMQSLICLLSRVAQPLDVSKPLDENRLYQYTDYNFNISIISSPYLIRTQKPDPTDFTLPFHLHLDEPDLTWTSRINQSDYIILSAGQWFFRPSYFHLNRTLAGCLYCSEPNITHLPSSFAYRLAFRTALRAINAAVGFRGAAFVRTYAPSHFEGGAWDRGGDCRRRRPFRRGERGLEEYEAEMYRIQVEAAGIAGGRVLRVFDATKAMVMRGDGHPGKYGRVWGVNETFPRDCVHWCLPGPIDAWNDLLQELLRRELEGYYGGVEEAL